MNQQDDSHHTGNSQDHDGGQSLVPAASEHAGSEDRSAEKMAKEASEGASKEPSTSITLQRMPTQSSWENNDFGDAPPQPQAQRRNPTKNQKIGLAAHVGAMSGAGTTWLSTE